MSRSPAGSTVAPDQGKVVEEFTSGTHISPLRRQYIAIDGIGHRTHRTDRGYGRRVVGPIRPMGPMVLCPMHPSARASVSA